MKLIPKKLLILVAALAALVAVSAPLRAEDWLLTGAGVRVKTIAFIDIDVYEISHFMKQAPASRSKQAVIDADVPKKFVWRMMRDVDQEKIHDALTGAFAMNGYKDQAKIKAFVGAFKAELKEGSRVTIQYDPEKKSTTALVGGSSASVAGVDFMKAVWSIWLGKIDQPKLGDQLIGRLK
ncbi:MAG TPA: chalcone isomerase family protein [Sorangium sp.]|uniref:chalcone isomerase family protein n=1 Tax=Sorangium sp. So ce388 TaxID=3133309 RepID=UPI002BB8E2D9|nr:chalcone isomerase family protein [Sorangium sp.]